MMADSIMLFWPSFIGVSVIALVHLQVPRFRFMRKQDNLWLPASVGVTMAYVFVDIFPHLAKVGGKLVNTEENSLHGFLGHNIYLVSLLGFAVYLGIILLVRTYRQNQSASHITYASAPATVKVEIATLVAYNFLIGYLLAEQPTHRPEPSIIFALAMTIHLAGVDWLVRVHFTNLYDQTARFGFAAAIFAGWITGVLLEISDATLALWYALIAGGIIVIATVHEIPKIRSPREYGFFCVGAGVFSALVLAAKYFG